MKTIKKIGLVSAVAFAIFALSACEDFSSAGGDNGSGGNRGGIPDTVETFMELLDYDCGKSQKCVATYLTEYHNMAVCDGDNGWVIGTLIEKMDCDFSSSSDKSSDSKDNPSSAGTSTKSSNSNTSGNDAKSSSSAGKEVSSSSAVTLATPCKTETEDNCEYGELVDERDGQTYKTVKIGTQTWMAENLNYDPGQGGSGSSAYDWSWCYDDDPSNCAKYGRLYTWVAAMDSATTGCGDRKYSEACTGRVQGVCPNGWLLPDTAEWRALFAAVAEDLNTAGTALKTTSGWYDDGNGTDAFGFSALPSGNRSSYDGNFNNAGNYAHFWSSSEFMLGDAYSLYLNYADASAARGLSVKNFAFAVRCIKDSD